MAVLIKNIVLNSLAKQHNPKTRAQQASSLEQFFHWQHWRKGFIITARGISEDQRKVCISERIFSRV